MTSSSRPVTPMPGSMTTHCSPGAGRDDLAVGVGHVGRETRDEHGRRTACGSGRRSAQGFRTASRGRASSVDCPRADCHEPSGGTTSADEPAAPRGRTPAAAAPARGAPRARGRARRRFTLIASVVGTLAVVAVVVIVIVVTTGGGTTRRRRRRRTVQAEHRDQPPATSARSPARRAHSSPARPAPRRRRARRVTFEGVTVRAPPTSAGSPKVTSKATGTPTQLAVQGPRGRQGQGGRATRRRSPSSTPASSTRTARSSTRPGQPGTKPAAVLPDRRRRPASPGHRRHRQGVAPMRVGGRRDHDPAAAPGLRRPGAERRSRPNSTLVFVVDLVKRRS